LRVPRRCVVARPRARCRRPAWDQHGQR